MSWNSLESRQNYEFEALQSIYGDDLKDLRKKAAWNKWTPLNLSITLRPQQGSSGNQEVYVKVDLHVICSEKYPEVIPDILLENGKGISQTILTILKGELENTAKQNEGQEMIFQLSQYVEEFLYRHNKPAMKSFYDEMVKKQKEEQMAQEQQKKLEEDRQRETMMKEVRERQEILKAEAKLIRERQRSVSEVEGEEETMSRKTSVTYRKRLNSYSESDSSSSCDDHKGIITLYFNGRGVQRGQCLRHSDPSNVIFIGLDVKSGEPVEISQWNLEAKNYDTSQILKNLSGIEQELNYLAKLRHNNLSHYLGFKHDVVGDKIVVYVLKEYIYGSSCYSLFSSQNLKVDIDILKHLVKGVLTAVDYIHRNNVVHKNLLDSCVFINDKGVVKVSDYSIHRRLLDLVASVHSSHNKKSDIFDFGKFVLTLLRQQSSSDDNVEIPSNLQSDLYDLLTKCLSKDENARYTAIQLLSHSFFHTATAHFSPQHVPPDTPLERNSSPEIVHNLSSLSNTSANSQSRINNEFEILEHLGRGAFGDVLKAKNKLDGGYYAIKRIKLNPKNKTLNKKIVREVMLLSRLNHENVVRYYNSWIETTSIKCDPDEDSSTTTTQTTEPSEKVLKVMRKDEFTLNDDIEKLVPAMKNNFTTVTYDSKSQAAYDESSDDDSSDEDEEDSFASNVKFGQDSDSDSIEFERGSNEHSSSKTSLSIDGSSKTNISLQNEVAKELVRQEDYLYIQMEFCEKSTLRTAIDTDLYLDDDRVWRLFREIVEGLAHIHQQGMIHRDLKPVNIFLDSSDHVKIGDFGLATTIVIRSKQGEISGISKSQVESLKEDILEESKTGQVGTALYVAPEINTAAKAIYNQKVDIYSLGIILFEMCYKPLETAMERIKLLTKLRQEEISFPDDFSRKDDRAHFLIRWLLSHDISKRPTSQELLDSNKLPPPVSQQRQLQELVRHTLNHPELKGYKYLISSCFTQTSTPAQDITYDRDPSTPITSKPLNIYEFVRETCVKIFKQHGGQNLATPLLMPKSTYYEDVESCVKLMTHFGNIVSLPHDLRVPFARFVAWNNINSFRRYSVERVYKEKKVFGFIPREFYECAFDIVTPTQGNLMSDAEILYIVYEIINELPGVKNINFLIRLNHTGLLKALLIHCGLKEKHEILFRLLLDIKEGKVPKTQLNIFLMRQGLSDNMIQCLISFLHSEYEIMKAVSQFQSITRKKTGEAGNLARLALQELKTIIHNAEIYGVEFDFVIAPGLVYNIQQYSGMICQFVCELKKKRKLDNKEVVAAGGRYDAMISYYHSVIEHTKGVQQSAVGISISLDKLVQAVQKQASEDLPKLYSLDAIVCSVGSKQLIMEKTKLKVLQDGTNSFITMGISKMILRSLWAAGIRCCLIESTNLDEVRDQLTKVGVPHAIILKDNDQMTVRVRSWDKDSKESYDRFQEKHYSTYELVENMQRILKKRSDSIGDNAQVTSMLSRSESKTSYSEKSDCEPVVETLIVTVEKLSSNTRKRYESQTKSQLDGLFKKLTGFITVIGISIESNVVRTLTSFLDFDTEDFYWKSVQDCIGKHQRHKQYINEICDEIWTVKMRKTNPTIVLYSLSDNFYKLII